MERFLLSMKTDRVNWKTYRVRDEAWVDVFHHIDRFYNPRRGHSTLNYESPIAFGTKMTVA